MSFAPLLTDPASPGQRKQLVMQSVGPFAIRDGHWKLCVCPGSGSTLDFGNEPRQDDAWRAALQALGSSLSTADLSRAPFVQLFDLAQDPHEDHNLAADNPDRVQAMLSSLQSQIDRGRSTPGPGMRNDAKIIQLFQRVPEFVRAQLP